MILAILILQIFEYQGYDVSYSGASPLNTDWDGTSEFLNIIYFNTFNVTIVTNWMDLLIAKDISNCRNKLLIIISPEKPYTYLDLVSIKSIFRENFSILIADEGPYSNAILEILNIPVSVDGLNYIDINNNYIVNGTISMDDRELQIWFAYASPLKIYNHSICKPFAFVSNHIVGVECNRNIPAIIFGDGSIFTNAVLHEHSIHNPYRQVILEIVKKLSINRHTCVFIDASKFWLRFISIDELVKHNISSDRIVVSLIRPIRYLANFIKGLNDIFLFSSHITLIFISITIFTILTILLSLNKIKIRYNIETIEKSTSVKPPVWEIVRRVCRYLKNCPSECKTQRLGFSRRKCLDYVNDINNYELDKKIYFLSQLILE